MTKDKVIEYLKSLGFVTVSHKSSSKQIYSKDDLSVIVKERNYKK